MELKLQLGGGLQSYEHPDYESIDIIPSRDIKYVWNLENGLPKYLDDHGIQKKIYEDNSVDEIIAFHVLEHIYDLISLVDEIHDALKTDGVLWVKVPNGRHVRAAWSDPTHKRVFLEETFKYWTHEMLTAYPYTNKAWRIHDGYPVVNGTPPDDLWEIECKMSPIK